jgi:predicted metal-dependent hydrolase
MDNAKLSKEEIMRLIEYARDVIPQRVEYYAPIVDVTYSKISIKAMRTKWGSCSSNGNLCFNCLLMLAPMDVLDSVVVHELCHIKEMNHFCYASSGSLGVGIQ